MAIQRLDHINFITHDMDATLDFYCNVIGLEQGKDIPTDTTGMKYLYVPGGDIAILHIGDAKMAKRRPTFERFADLNVGNAGAFSTGSIDHVCLAVDGSDYDAYIKRLDERKLSYQTQNEDEIPLRQIWVLDPNGVRVELNFPKGTQ